MDNSTFDKNNIEDNSNSEFETIVDRKLVENIANMQVIPEDVVIDFLKCKSSLCNTDFKSRIVY